VLLNWYTLNVRSIVRIATFSALSLYAAHLLIRGFDFGSVEFRTFILLILALSILNMFAAPILGVISLPIKGLGFLLLNFMLTFVILFILTVFIPWFNFIPSDVPELNILGFMLPSKQLSALGSGILSALIFSMVYNFLNWISGK
jgi:uncharacterized membrane protein YvlD (DUF360 family)